MLKQWITRYKAWEQESLQVLLDPSRVEQLGPSQRWWARHLAAMSELERRQLFELSVRWPLERVLKVGTAIALGMAALGLALHLAFPRVPLFLAVLVTEALGLGLTSMAFGVQFYYRLVMHYKVKLMVSITSVATSGVATGIGMQAYESGRPAWAALREAGPATALIGLGVGAFFMLFLLGAAAWRSAAYEKLAVKLQAEAERERLARQLTETQLRLLHAQIEPHFLFNTLGAVQQLAEREHASAAAGLTASLIAFLRATAGGMAQEMATLRDEFDLAQAYLNVMRARLGGRLEVRLDLPPELAAYQVPGMAVLTLAENAVKHGVEPASHPTRIVVAAEREDGQLLVRVSDTGAGLRQVSSGGMGLRNLRDRLRLAFGAQAALALFEGEEGGVTAAISIALPEPAALAGAAA